MRPSLLKQLVPLLMAVILILLPVLAGSWWSFGLFSGVSFRYRLLGVWVVTEAGEIELSTTSDPLPDGWKYVPREGRDRLVIASEKGRNSGLAVLELSGDTGRYLVARFPMPIFQGMADHNSRLRVAGFALSIVLALAVGCSLLVVVYFQRKARVVRQVLSRLQRGDLSARLPVRGLDEPGELMARFNEMADEIERLVQRLRAAESARRETLRELAHDIRTPLTSLRYAVELVREQRDRLPPEELVAHMSLAENEIDYFQRLIEDLFLLAQIEEPRYRPDPGVTGLDDLVAEEIGGQEGRLEIQGRRLDIRFTDRSRGARVKGDTHLFRRLIRNLIENACENARTRVRVRLEALPSGELELAVTDDGPGFTADALEAYGRRRTTRWLEARSREKVSIGLGSVIVRSIVEAHRGALTVRNLGEPGGNPAGAEVVVTLPAELSSGLRAA